MSYADTQKQSKDTGAAAGEAELAAARRELARGTRGERVVVNASAAADDRHIIHYVLDGRAGNMPISPNGVFHIDEMRENLVPLPYTDSEDTKKRRFNTHLITQTFGTVTVWIPSKSSLIESG